MPDGTPFGVQHGQTAVMRGDDRPAAVMARRAPALVKKSTGVLADEPIAALDTGNTDLVLGVPRTLANEGCAVIVATHSKEVEGRCDSALALCPLAADPLFRRITLSQGRRRPRPGGPSGSLLPPGADVSELI